MDRTEMLERYLNQIETADPNDDSQFTALIKASEHVLMLPDADFAREIKLSRTTINRWRSGKHFPHPFMRPGVFDWLARRSKAQLKKAKAFDKANEQDAGPRMPLVASPRY